MILPPKKTPGVKIVRHVTTFGSNDAPFGEPELAFDNILVPAANILPGGAQRAFKLMPDCVEERSTFGRRLSQH